MGATVLSSFGLECCWDTYIIVLLQPNTPDKRSAVSGLPGQSLTPGTEQLWLQRDPWRGLVLHYAWAPL